DGIRGLIVTGVQTCALPIYRLQPFQDRIAIKEGDLLSSNDLEPVVKGQDAILSAFGPRVPIARADANLLQRFAVALTNAMRSSRSEERRVGKEGRTRIGQEW